MLIKKLTLAFLVVSLLSTSHAQELDISTEDDSSLEDIELEDIELGGEPEQLSNSANSIRSLKQNEEDAADELNRILRRSCMIISDVISIGASALYCSYYPTNAIPISQAGSALYATNFTLDHLLDLPNQINEIRKEDCNKLGKAMFALAQAAEAASISGFACLAFSDQVKIGSWLIAAGLSARMLTGGYRIAAHGCENVYGKQHPILNFVLRMGLENGGGTVGSYILGIGACLNNPELDYIGSLVVGSTVGFGSLCVLAENIYQLCHLN